MSPAKSKSQQRLFGMALSVKRGEQSLSDLPDSVRDDVKQITNDMSEEDIRKYAKTKHKGKPETVESIGEHYMSIVDKWLSESIKDRELRDLRKDTEATAEEGEFSDKEVEENIRDREERELRDEPVQDLENENIRDRDERDLRDEPVQHLTKERLERIVREELARFRGKRLNEATVNIWGFKFAIGPMGATDMDGEFYSWDIIKALYEAGKKRGYVR